MVEFANRLIARGHEVTFYLPDTQDLRCTWMRCDAAIRPLSAAAREELDVVVFNHEPQWYLLDRFENARRRVFYALHDGSLYGKEGSWEARWAPVDLQLANSSWTASQLEADTGSRPVVVLGGVNRDIFRPRGGPKRYPVLCSGIDKPWKGTDTILAAGRMAGLPVEQYAHKNLSQPHLGQEYDAAELFAVGSWFEGFCQPGLEALASGVPLVTTDCGGCHEYAVDGETALVVPPRDASAMAAALRCLHDDPSLAAELRERGLELVEERFDWERATDRFAEILDGVAAGVDLAPPPSRPAPPDQPDLSIVVLAYDNLVLTQRCIESVRRHTSVPYELIVVDNGSERDAAHYADLAADHPVLNDDNRGFAGGMNQGLEAARGEWVAFCNNDIEVPEGWADRLIETAKDEPEAGIVVPAITEARDRTTVRDRPGSTVETLPPFSAPPPAVVYLMRTDIARELDGWSERYQVASGEDVDLAFKVWVNELDIVYDSRVLVDHVGKATARRLDDWQTLWARNRKVFLDFWTGPESVPRLASCDPDRHERNREIARAAAQWMGKYFRARDEPRRILDWERLAEVGESSARRVWTRISPHLPARAVYTVRRLADRRTGP